MGNVSVSLINQHVRHIETAITNTRFALFDLIKAIKDARDDLGDDVFNNELADKLSISQSTLSKYLRIANCTPLIKRQKSLPPTLTTLYSLVQTHSKLVKVEGADKADESFNKVLQKLSPLSEAKDVAPFLKKASERWKKKNQNNREVKILSLSASDTSYVKGSTKIEPLSKIFSGDKKYRTIFISPTPQLIKDACNHGVLSSDIAEQYPIADLRAPSTAITVQGFVYCAANQIDGGLKILNACGFEFRDIIVPCNGDQGFNLLNRDKILIRGERGAENHPKLRSGMETSLQGALTIAEELGDKPRLYIFASESYEGWTCAK